MTPLLKEALRLVPWRYKLQALIFFSTTTSSPKWLARFAHKFPDKYGKLKQYVCWNLCWFAQKETGIICYDDCPILKAQGAIK